MEQVVDVEKLIGELEIAVDRLRSLYDQYFVGLEKLEPGVPRKDVDRRIYALRKEQIRNTALRFRFQMVLQRYNTYQTHWGRICREIDNGTYKRHLIRAQRRFGSTQPPAARRSAPPPALPPTPPANPPLEVVAQPSSLETEFALAMGIDIDIEADQPVARPPPPPPGSRGIPPAPPDPSRTAVPRPAPPTWKKVAPVPVAERAPTEVPRPLAAPPRPAPPVPTVVASPAALPGDLPDERLRELYAEYLGVKRKQNESTAAITYQAVAKSLRESGDKLRKKHGKPVDFEVVVRDGKTMLRPVLK